MAIPSPHPLIIMRDLNFCSLHTEISLNINFQSDPIVLIFCRYRWALPIIVFHGLGYVIPLSLIGGSRGLGSRVLSVGV